MPVILHNLRKQQSYNSTILIQSKLEILATFTLYY